MHIIPAILPKNKTELINGLQRLIDAGYSGKIQIDLCDGVFVPSVTWPFSEYAHTKDFLEHAGHFVVDSDIAELLHQFEVEYDLMVDQAEYLFSVWDALQPSRIILHLDAIQDEESLAIDLLAKNSPFGFVAQKNITFAISQTTPVDRFAVWYTELGIHHVQVMGIATIGKQGESFTDQTIDIIDQLQKKYPDIVISVDGGVNHASIPKLAKVGVTTVVAGSAVFTGDIAKNLAELQKSATL